MNQITLMSIKLDGHRVEIPTGLSELLATTWVAEPKEHIYTNDYNRNVIKKGDRFVTVLTKKGGK